VYEANCRELGVVIPQYSVSVGINGKYSAGNKLETSLHILTKSQKTCDPVWWIIVGLEKWVQRYVNQILMCKKKKKRKKRQRRKSGNSAGGSKGKGIPLQAWTGPEGSRRLRLPDFKTVGT
jgi:hypothetical protein